jgi:hypothetical protein
VEAVTDESKKNHNKVEGRRKLGSTVGESVVFMKKKRSFFKK